MSAFMCIMHALKHVSSSLFFINYRVISSLLLLLTGVLFFGEELSAYNLLGFALGFIVFFLLYENEKSEKKEKDIRTGMLYLGGAIVLAGLGHTIFKCISSEVDIYSFYFFRGLTAGICISLFLFVFQKKRVQVPSVGVVILALIHAVLFTSYYVYFLQKAYAFGYLSISYKILSYSIFIPIILSIIFYKEKLTLKRVLAFILTVISVLFFMY
ncbi:MAG: EamA family transporter [Candidatus Peribacteria bacterium]|nr:MAG: EamA family transporter [Candidatus Peribacteria bacterium]